MTGSLEVRWVSRRSWNCHLIREEMVYVQKEITWGGWLDRPRQNDTDECTAWPTKSKRDRCQCLGKARCGTISRTVKIHLVQHSISLIGPSFVKGKNVISIAQNCSISYMLGNKIFSFSFSSLSSTANPLISPQNTEAFYFKISLLSWCDILILWKAGIWLREFLFKQLY